MIPIVHNPLADDWPDLCRRPNAGQPQLRALVEQIFEDVRSGGDTALRDYAQRFDAMDRSLPFLVDARDIRAARTLVPTDLQEAIAVARSAIEMFHRAQLRKDFTLETMPGVVCSQRMVPIQTAGLYVPGGSAPLFSTFLMLAIPALVAGCDSIIVCTPPAANSLPDPTILYCADVLGIRQVYRIGGAQAIAAMVYGTESIPRADKIFGPGNRYVTQAKQYAGMLGCAIDMPAGPSELLVIADAGARPDYVAADLLSQAEHGPDSQVLLLTDCAALAGAANAALARQLADLPRKNIAARALRHARIIVFPELRTALDFANAYAPEHLMLACKDAERCCDAIRNVGTVFLGYNTPESVGDYAGGPNHTLPTNGFARSYGALTTDAFMKAVNYQRLSPAGLRAIGPVVERMARAEHLEAHANAVAIRIAGGMQ